MPRPYRIAFEGATYHVTIRGNNNEVVFRDDQDRRNYLERLTQARQRYGIRTLAYVLMTNHIHLLTSTPRANISAAMQWLHGCYAAQFNRRHRRRGHLFRGRFFGLPIETDEHLLESTRYIHLNPVRAGLVEGPGKHRWSSYRWYVEKADVLVPIDCDRILEILSPYPERRASVYRRFVAEGLVTGQAPHTDRRDGDIATASTAMVDILAIPRSALFQRTPRNRVRTLVMAVLAGLGPFSSGDIAAFFAVTPRAVMTAAWRLRRKVRCDPQIADRVELLRSAALNAPGVARPKRG